MHILVSLIFTIACPLAFLSVISTFGTIKNLIMLLSEVYIFDIVRVKIKLNGTFKETGSKL